MRALRKLFGKGQDRGFTLIELLIVILIVGILAAVGAPLYLGYIKDAKTAEAKAQAGSLWTAVQSQGVANCDTNVDVTSGYSKAGFDSAGNSSPARWTIGQHITTFKVACATGAITPDGDVFRIDGTGTDVSFLKVKLIYSAAGTPPSALQCNTDGVTWNPC
jgi:type IV pilus assembly protein PilA